MWPTVFAILLTLAGGTSPENSCDDDVVLLQHSHMVNVHKKSLDPSYYGPDEDGMCKWARVFGAELPTTVNEASRVFENGDADYSSEMDGHPLFCKEITDLIHASDGYQQDGFDHASLLSKTQALDENQQDEMTDLMQDGIDHAGTDRASLLSKRALLSNRAISSIEVGLSGKSRRRRTDETEERRRRSYNSVQANGMSAQGYPGYR